MPIEKINSVSRLSLSPFSLNESEAVLSTIFSPSGALMATVGSTGEAKILLVSARSDRSNWPLLRVLRDEEETELEEFFTGAFWGNQFVAAGKRKSRRKWDNGEGDHAVLSGVVKIFDLKSGRCVQRLTGVHSEEILFVLTEEQVSGVGEAALITCGQDGLMARWQKQVNKPPQVVKAGDMVFHAEIWENFIFAAVDNFLKVFDRRNLKVNEGRN